MSVALSSLGAAAGISLLALAGRLLLLASGERRDRVMTGLVSLAVGALLGGALIHLVPRSINAHGGPSVQVMLLVVIGFVGFFLLEKTLHAHHHHAVSGGQTTRGAGPEPGRATPRWVRRLSGGDVEPVVPMILVGDGVHNFIDGAVLVAAFSVNTEFGLVTALAIGLHEITQEAGDFGVLVAGGLAPRRALALNLASASLAVAGVAVALALGSVVQDLEAWVLPLAAGNFLYIAASDLVPQLHAERTARDAYVQVLVISAGVAAMVGVRMLRQALT